MIITVVLVVAAAVGVFIFVKNNPNKTKKINDTVNDTVSKIENSVKK